jgi:hypothetical protein
MTTDFRAMCAELVDALENARRIIDGADGTLHINTAEFVLRRARALLDQPPADREAAKLAAELRHFVAGYQQMRGLDPEHVYSIHRGDAMEAHLRISRLSRIAELLERPTPQPVVPTDDDLEDLAEVMNVSGNPVPAMRRALELWGANAQ